MNELALFAGAGGGILGSHLLGWRTVAAVEIEEYPRAVLLQRQLDGHLPRFPIWDDVCTFDGKPWRERVDIITGGFPCQDISLAGNPLGDRQGIDGERSGLWSEMSRIIGEVMPRYVLVENSPALTFSGLGRVVSDLSTMGYDSKWGVIGANSAGAPHIRERIWILADSTKVRRNTGANNSRKESEKTRWHIPGQCGQTLAVPSRETKGSTPGWWVTEPGLGRVANGVADRVDRLKAIGNGQVPAVVKIAVEILGGRLK